MRLRSFLERMKERGRSSMPTAEKPAVLQLPCRADLWCRKRTSLSNMLDPDLFERYMTGDDRLDEDWIVQSNPPCAFKAEFAEGCQALLELLNEDPSLHATKGWLTFTPDQNSSDKKPAEADYLAKMS